jgi:spore maturation protein CgeB
MIDDLENADVIVLGPDHADSFAVNIAEGLKSLAITAAVIDPNRGFSRLGTLQGYTTYFQIMSEAVRHVHPLERFVVDRPIERQLTQSSPSLVISVWSQFSPAQIERWRGLTPGAMWVFWYPDHLANLGAHRALIAPYDHFFFKEPFLVDLLSAKTNLPVHMLADACNPDRHRPEEPANEVERRQYQCDIAIAGNLYTYRLLVMEAIPEETDLRIYGHLRNALPKRFERFSGAFTGEYVTWRTKSLAFRGAKIVLNTMHYAEIRGVNARLFEATACGGFVLSHAGPDIAQYYEPGVEIATFDSSAELRDAIGYYLGAEEERRKIASAGLARAHRDHTHPRRMVEMLHTLGLAEKLGIAETS